MSHYLKEELYGFIKNDESLFDFILEGSLDGLWYWDLENPENKWMNDRFWQVLGYNPEEIPHEASSWQDKINKEDLNVALVNINKHIEDPSYTYDQEVRYKHKNGSTVWVRCRGISIRDGQGKPVRMLGTHQDITIHKQTQTELLQQELVQAKEDAEESEIKLLAALESMSDAVFIADKDGGIINVNKSYLKLTEFKDTEDMLTQFENYPDLFEVYLKTGEVAPIEMWAVPRALKGETAVNEIYKIKRKDRDYHWFGSYNFAPIMINNQIAGCVVTIRDVTDELKQEEELKNHRLHLEELVKERTEELEEKNIELEKFNHLFVGREFRIKELKKKVQELENKLKTFDQNNSNQ